MSQPRGWLGLAAVNCSARAAAERKSRALRCSRRVSRSGGSDVFAVDTGLGCGDLPRLDLDVDVPRVIVFDNLRVIRGRSGDPRA